MRLLPYFVAKSDRRHSGKYSRPRIRLGIEHLEARTVPAILVANTLDDGAGSLRDAIRLSNETPGRDVIQFAISETDANHFFYSDDGISGQISLGNKTHATTTAGSSIPGSDPDHPGSWWTIQLQGDLEITDPVDIEGWSQGVSQGLRNYTGMPLIQLTGGTITVQLSGGGGAVGSGTTVRGLALSSGGLNLNGGGNTVQGNFIGTDPSGLLKTSDVTGLRITSNFNQIGTDDTPDASERNVITGGVAVEYVILGDQFESAAVILGGSNNTFRGNYVGITSTGTGALRSVPDTGNATTGIVVGGFNNEIGIKLSDTEDHDVLERNTVSGFTYLGLLIHGTGSHRIQGNFIGTDATGMTAVANGGFGILINYTSGNQVRENVISGNSVGGVAISSLANNNYLFDNWIGTKSDHQSELKNNVFGVALGRITPHHNYVGISPISPNGSNVIAYNGVGVGLFDVSQLRPSDPYQDSPYSISIRGNQIYSNVGLGIDLGGLYSAELAYTYWPSFQILPDGPTANDDDNIDSGGANYLQNYPTITEFSFGDKIRIAGVMDGRAGELFTLDFYGDSEARPYVVFDPSTNTSTTKLVSQGRYHLGTKELVGNGEFDVELPWPASFENSLIRYITATATDSQGNTSEFSLLPYEPDQPPGAAIFLDQGDELIEILEDESGQVEVVVDGVSKGVFGGPLFVSGGRGEDTFSVAASPVGGLTIDGAKGDDRYIINFGHLGGTVSAIDSVDGKDTLILIGTDLSDEITKAPGKTTWKKAGQDVTETVEFSGMEVLKIDGKGGNDNLIDPGTDTTLVGGPGDDTITITATTDNGVVVDGEEGADTIVVMLGDLGGPVTIDDGGIAGVTTIRIVGTGGDDQWVLSDTGLSSGSEQVYLNLNSGSIHLILDGGDGDDVVTVEGNLPTAVSLELLSLVQDVTIDIKPEDEANTINVSSSGVITVALFTTGNFDASQVSVPSVVFAGARVHHSRLTDIDGDGDLDLVMQFRLQETDLFEIYANLLRNDILEDGVLNSTHQSTRARLTGNLVNGNSFAGEDSMDLFLSGRELRELIESILAGG